MTYTEAARINSQFKLLLKTVHKFATFSCRSVVFPQVYMLGKVGRQETVIVFLVRQFVMPVLLKSFLKFNYVDGFG